MVFSRREGEVGEGVGKSGKVVCRWWSVFVRNICGVDEFNFVIE